MGKVLPSSGQFRWTPSAEVIAQTNLTAFLRRTGMSDVSKVFERAEREPAWFWHELIQWAGIRFYKPYDQIVDLSKGIPWARWCIGSQTNIVLNCLDRYRDTPTYGKALLLWEGEDGRRRQFTYNEFDSAVCSVASGLRAKGFGKGDVIALFMPNLPEAFVAFFAILKIGAIVMPLYSGFGPKALTARIREGLAKAVFTADGTRRRGQVIRMKDTIDQALVDCPEVRHCILVPDLGLDGNRSSRDVLWNDLRRASNPADVQTEPMGSSDPSLLLFTSGTTGKPKGVIYTHIGFMAKMACDMGLCFDFQARDRFFWLCDLGWMAGSMVAVVPPLQGGSVLIADGAPDYPAPGRIWDMVERHAVSYLAVAPTMIRAMMQHDAAPVAQRPFKDLRVVYSSGEPWTDTPWNWLYANVCKEKLPILNGTGGTEVGGCILGCTLHHRLKPSSFSTAMPAMGADIVDEHGKSVAPGAMGELVLRRSSIGLTAGLWRDDGTRYLESYWSRFPDVWVHGDLAYQDEDGHWYVPGRSDDTMNVAGRRIAPAEVENVLMETQLLIEAAAVAIPDPITGVAMVCVCVLRPGVADDAVTRKRLSEAVTGALGRSYRPKHIIITSDIPKTRSAKIMRRTVRAALTGEEQGDLSALANPEAVEQLRQAATAALAGTTR